MAKAKKAKKKKGKVRDLKPRKMVKGGSKFGGGQRPGDPCDGGEIIGKMG
jgi:hypothetical protein